jgi:tetratricopeptide (TPR) repeat protein/CHAT domain-containing protein
MRPSKRGRGVRARTLSLSLFVLGLVTAFTRNAAAADPLAVQKTAPLSDADRKTLLSERDRFDRESAALQAKGQYAEAMAAAEKMLAIERRVLGDMSADVAGSLDRIALCHVAREEFAAACKAFQEEVTILAKLHGEKDWHLANARTALKDAEILARSTPEVRREIVQAIRTNSQANALAAKGDFRRAIPLATKALETRRRIYGDQNVWTSQSLGTLATLYAAVGDYKHAEALGRQAIEIDRTVLGDDHVATAIALNNLAVLYRSMGDSRKAEPLFLQTLQVFKKVLGDKHPNTVQAQANLAMVYNSMGQYAKAEPLFRQALEIVKNSGKNPELAAQIRSGLALLCEATGRYDEAERLDLDVLEIRRKALGEKHPSTAESLNNLAGLYLSRGDFAKAEPLYQQALAIERQVFGENHPNTAMILLNLAGLYRLMGEYAKAEPLIRQTLAIRKKVLGEGHPDTGATLHSMALLYEAMGDYAKAEPLYRQAIEIDKKILGEDHPNTAADLNNLAHLSDLMGDYQQAESLYRRALQILRKTVGEYSPNTANTLNNLAKLYNQMGENAKAEQFYLKSLEIKQKVYGEQHADTAKTFNNLGFLYESLGDYEKAERFYLHAQEIFRKVLGENHADTARNLYTLAWVYRKMGNYAKAEALYRQALEIYQKVLGEKHPDTAKALGALASLYGATGDYTKAESLSRQALAIDEEHFDNCMRIRSEREQLALKSLLRSGLDGYLSLTVQAHVDAAEVYRHVLAWKGAIFMGQFANRALRHRPDLAPRFEQLEAISVRISNLALRDAKPEGRAAWERQIAELSDQKDALEAELSGKSAEFRQDQAVRRLAPAELQQILPERAALVDFLEYEHSSPPHSSKGPLTTERRLVAFVVRKGRPIERIEFGPVQPLAIAAEDWRRAILRGGGGEEPVAGGTVPQHQHPQHTLQKLLWNTLQSSLKGADTVLISPDGALNQIPLAALPGRKAGSYLLEEYNLAVVPVPQLLPLLLRTPTTNRESAAAAAEGSGDQSLLIVGDVSYGGSPGKSNKDLLADSRSTQRGQRAGSLQFAELPGSVTELATIEESFEQSFPKGKLHSLRRDKATESAFRAEAPACRWLHLATHGFFAPPNLASALAPQPKGNDPGEFARQGVSGSHPGLLSGVALSGANTRVAAGQDDGILTAVEVTGLDLERTELVVLSACETGLGHTAGGEGVLGLQRAFQIAGAKNVVASLWKVDDQATAALMRLFYHKLWADKKSPTVALREAQLWILNNPDQIPTLATVRGAKFDHIVQLPQGGKRPEVNKRSSPYFWAGFAVSGTGN